MIELQSEFTCPKCGHKKLKQCEQMPVSIIMNVRRAAN